MSDAKGDLIKKGETLFVQGDIPGGIYLLQSGSMEILSASDEFNGLDKSIILAKSRRVGIIKGKSIIPSFSMGLVEPSKKSVRAIEDSYISKYPLKEGGFRGIAGRDQAQALAILKQLYKRFNISLNELEKFKKLYINLSRISDNLALIYRELSITNASEKLHLKSEKLYNEYNSSGGAFPSPISAKFLVSDNSSSLNKKYQIPGDFSVINGNKNFISFAGSFLEVDPSVVRAVFKSESSIALQLFDAVSSDFINTVDLIEGLYGLIEKELDDLFGNDASWTSYLVDGGGFSEWENSGKLEREFIKNFLKIVVKINSVFEELTGKKLTEDYPGIKKIHIYYTKAGSSRVEETVKSSAGLPAGSSGVKELRRSMSRIFEFALVGKEFQNSFIKLLNEFKNMKNPFNTESDGRKVRRHITKLYWDLYKQVYLRSRAEKNVPLSVRLMLRFGYMDEGLLQDDQLTELTKIIRIKEESKKIPVVFEDEFLSMIQSGEEQPSITEMGLTYRQFLREEEKHSRRRDGAEGTEDENVKMTLYEIDQRLKSTAAVCSGSTATAFPILNSFALKGNLSTMYVSKQKVAKIIEDLMNIDFSVFYRETVLKLGEAREIIQEEVIPYFILLPIFGSRTLLWQELSGTDKRTRGRIVVPIFFLGDLVKNLAHTLACFRWELNRTIKGQAMWADPIEGGITGEYFDYVNTFKKNSNLSMEAKEKVASKFKSLRTNRDRFADDYMMWGLFEKDGIMKLNNVVRGMFYKHIPFKKEVRDKLESMPAFTQFANRYKNVTSKKIQAYERRFKKYKNEEDKYPEQIGKFMEFLKM